MRERLNKPGLVGLDGELIAGDPVEPGVVQRSVSAGMARAGRNDALTFFVFVSFANPTAPFRERLGVAERAVRRVPSPRRREKSHRARGRLIAVLIVGSISFRWGVLILLVLALYHFWNEQWTYATLALIYGAFLTFVKAIAMGLMRLSGDHSGSGSEAGRPAHDPRASNIFTTMNSNIGARGRKPWAAPLRP